MQYSVFYFYETEKKTNFYSSSDPGAEHIAMSDAYINFQSSRSVLVELKATVKI